MANFERQNYCVRILNITILYAFICGNLRGEKKKGIGEQT